VPGAGLQKRACIFLKIFKIRKSTVYLTKTRRLLLKLAKRAYRWFLTAKKIPPNGIIIYDSGIYLSGGRKRPGFSGRFSSTAIQIEWDRMGG
jgi:hypothetical protein